MILAAGRGTRLAPLTATVPKPLVEVGGSSLIERHLARLSAAGFRDVVINLAHLGHLIEQRLGTGEAFGLRIAYSREADGPLETGGGVAHALPLLGGAPFLLVNADIWTDYPFDAHARSTAGAHLVVVANPNHHPAGDFELDRGRLVRATHQPYTYAGIGVYHPAVFSACRNRRFALAPLLFDLAQCGQLTGEHYPGLWFDIGTSERLAEARQAADSC